MKILIIGANGQLGHDCTDVLAAHHELLCLDRPAIDITVLDSIRKQINAFQPDAVVNCAAYTRVDGAEADEAICQKINSEGPMNIALALAGTNAMFVHISTDYVFDGSKPLGENYVEEDTPCPVSAYGRTKLAGEAPVLAYERGAVLRTAWLYGEHGNNFLKTMLRLSKRPAPIRVVSDQHGSPTWSGSLARQIEKLIGDFRPGLYHATSQGSCTWYDLTKRFFAAAGIDHEVISITTADYPTAATRPMNSVLDNRALQRAGLDVMPPWEEDIDKHARAFVRTWSEELEQTK